MAKESVPVPGTPFDETDGQLSPDGRWIAYTSNESGQNEMYVARFDGTRGASGGRWPVSNQGGRAPGWRGDGKELYYLAVDHGTMMAVEIRPSADGIDTGAPRQLFAASMPGASGGSPYTYDVTPMASASSFRNRR